MNTLVMKFGGASLSSSENVLRAAETIVRRRRDFDQVAVVVSAMGDTTDDLMGLAGEVCGDPPKRELDMLVSAGERISMALLAMALHEKGIDAVSFTGSQSGIITTDDHTEARVVDVRPYRLLPCLRAGQVVIVAGFQGMSEGKEITTLGRSGSDLTAVALGVALEGEVEFYKDVKGVFSEDPKRCKGAVFLPKLGYEEALLVAERGSVLHPRSIELAKRNGLVLRVKDFREGGLDCGTLIGGGMRSDIPIYEEALCRT